jgi:hypothetical protein
MRCAPERDPERPRQHERTRPCSAVRRRRHLPCSFVGDAFGSGVERQCARVRTYACRTVASSCEWHAMDAQQVIVAPQALHASAVHLSGGH